jgi:RecA/RadA recombinase
MAKKKAPEIDVASMTSDLLAGVVSKLNANKDIAAFNTGMSVANDVGIPLPALALRYLFQITAIPLSRIVQLIGEEGSAKSAFLTEMARWVLLHDGLYFFAENENKDTRTLRSSLLSWEDKLIKRVVDQPTKYMEAWQMFLTRSIESAKHLQMLKTGPGRTIPILFGVDSLTGTASKATIDKVIAQGFASKSYADVAYLVAQWMRCTPELIGNFPFLFVATNHAKPAKDDMGNPIYNVPGGKGTKFMETFEFLLKRVGDLKKANTKGIRIRFKNMKNSLGPGRKTIEANMLWQIIPHGEGFRQMTAWDWHTASIEMLQTFETEAKTRDAIKDVTGIRVTSVSKKLCYSDLLGAGDKSNPISYFQMSQILETRPDVLAKLYPVLHITPCVPFAPGHDYWIQQRDASKAAATVVATRYAQSALLPQLSGDELTDEGLTAPETNNCEQSSNEDDA